MTDTTNPPDEPAGGSVRTGDAVTPESDVPAAAADDAPGGTDADDAPDGVAGNGRAVDGARPTPGPRSAATNGAAAAPPPDLPAPAPGAPADVPVAAVPENAPDAGVAADAVSTPETGVDAATVVTAVPTPIPARAPIPAPGPVPGPGPGAAAPPPWRRMPDRDNAVMHAARPEPERGPASLLDDLPTAFVEPAGPPGRPSARPGTARGAGSVGERTGWSSMRTRVRPPRRAALQLKRLDPWSVLKLALVLAGVLFLIWLVAVGVLYGVLDGMGVWDRLNGTYSDLVSGDGSAGGGGTLISAGRVFGYAALFGAINSVLFAVSLTVGAFVYNVCADLVGGIEVTLSERD